MAPPVAPPFRATHLTAAAGAPTWAAPDPSAAPGPALPPELPVQVVEERGGWSHVVCANGWSAWTDGSRLTALAAPPAGEGRLRRQDLWPEVGQRARRLAPVLVGVALVGSVDFQLHGNAAVSLLITLGGAAGAMFFREVLARARRHIGARQLPGWTTSVVFTVPLAVFFYVRGKGTLQDGDGMMVGALMVGLPLLVNWLAPQVDPSLRGFYAARDRRLPRPVRPAVVAAGAVFFSFGILHGNLGDIRILWGGTASKAQTPTAGATMATVVVTMLLGFALMREPSDGPGGTP